MVGVGVEWGEGGGGVRRCRADGGERVGEREGKGEGE